MRQPRLRHAPPKPQDPFLLDRGLCRRLQPERPTDRRTINDKPVKLWKWDGTTTAGGQYMNRRQRSLEGQFAGIEHILGQTTIC
jgi:hypothetical protein